MRTFPSGHFQQEQAIMYLLSQKCWPKSAHLPLLVDCAKGYFTSLVKPIESSPSKDCRCKSCESLAGSPHCAEAPWAIPIPWACWAILLFSSMKRSGRNVLMNKSLTFQHLHLEGNTGWVVIVGLWKAHSCVLSVLTRGPLGLDSRPAGTEEFLYWLSGLGIRP